MAAKEHTPLPVLIARKRDGHELSEAQIEQFVSGVSTGSIPNEQIGAMLMAIYLKGMSTNETIFLTRSMIHSGETLKWPETFDGCVVDKHSTGGVGDKVSLPLAPALAACGLKVPMISGRGLGHTGGTLDKLESIPGFTVEQSPAQMQELLSSVGCCIVGQTATLVPGDRILYSVRDVTSTVDSIPLITASIVSKKVAEGLNDLVLDVKVGRAAFMKTEEEARELAKSMVDAGNGANVKTRALLTSMDHPIGNMIGNALEIIESVETLQGKGPEDLLELVTTLGGELLFANGKATSEAAGAEMILNALNDGTALAKFKGMIIKQGVEPELAEKLCSDPSSTLQKADIVTDIPALTSGFVHDIDAMGLAVFAGRMGAGRQVQTDKIQFEVGLQLKCCVGTEVSEGQSLVAVHHKKPLSEEQVATLQQCFTVKAEKITKRSRIIDVIS